MKILYVASEAVPFVKTGGLADVAFSLPKALKKQGIDIRVIIPKYKNISEELVEQMIYKKNIQVFIGDSFKYCGIFYMEYEEVPFYFIDNEHYFKRDAIYGYNDDGERYSYFCKAVLEVIKNIDFIPDIIHCNDWHTGMIMPLLQEHYQKDALYNKIKRIFTIHNLHYQGVFPMKMLESVLHLGKEHFHPEGLEFYGNINFMKAGINYSDAITTVSKTYSHEIQYSYYGEDLDGLLRYHKDKLYGITNGIDYDIYNPQKDKKIFKNYTRSLKAKQENKWKLQSLINLPQNREIPLMSMVTRLVSMKGLDLVLNILEDLLHEDIQIIIIGTGEAQYEKKLKELSQRYPDKLSVHIMFDEAFAHKTYAASDLFLMPSKFEPCGLGQLIALRYGAIPIVRETGGLKDTIHPYNKETGEGNGFSFTNYNAHDMLYVIRHALNTYQDKPIWKQLVRNAFKSKNSWDQSAKEYKKLYVDLLKK